MLLDGRQTYRVSGSVGQLKLMLFQVLRYLVQQWAIGLYDMYIKAAGGVNRLAHIHGQELADGVLGSSSTTYGLGIFELEPEEALVLEWKIPQTAYWSVQLQDVWSNPFDFFNYQTDLGISDAALARRREIYLTAFET